MCVEKNLHPIKKKVEVEEEEHCPADFCTVENVIIEEEGICKCAIKVQKTLKKYHF